MNRLGLHLDRVLRAAGLAIDGVSIGNPADKTTWRVTPSGLQAAAQPYIDAFNPADPAHALADADAQAAVLHQHQDRVADCALLLEKTDPGWATYTNAQKRSAVVACAKRWEQQRNWVTRNYEFMTF